MAQTETTARGCICLAGLLREDATTESVRAKECLPNRLSSPARAWPLPTGPVLATVRIGLPESLIAPPPLPSADQAHVMRDGNPRTPVQTGTHVRGAHLRSNPASALNGTYGRGPLVSRRSIWGARSGTPGGPMDSAERRTGGEQPVSSRHRGRGTSVSDVLSPGTRMRGGRRIGTPLLA